MKIPAKNTCAHAICFLLYKRNVRTAGEVVSDLKERFIRETILDKISDMISAGLIGRTPDGLHLSRAMEKHFDDIAAAAEPVRKRPTGSIATPRTAPAFRPLSAKYSLPVNGLRTGAADHRQHASRHLP